MFKYILISICLLSFVMGATPQYQVFPVWSNSLGDTSTQIINITVQRTGYVPEITDISLFSTLTRIDQHDSVLWTNSTHVIRLNNSVIITPGDTYQFTQPGTYSFESTTNANLTGTIEVSPVVHPTLEIFTVKPNGQFTITGPSTVVLDDAIKTIRLSESHTRAILAQSYPFEFIFHGPINQSFTKSLAYQARYTFNISDTLLSEYTLEAGQSIELGKLDIQNTGNIDYTVDLSMTGNATQFFRFPSSRLVFRDSIVTAGFIVDVPLTTENGLYKAVLRATNEQNEYNKTILLNVQDITKPEILNITLGNRTAIQENDIVLTAQDNVGLQSANFTINNETIKLNLDKNKFLGTYSVPEKNSYLYSYCVEDLNQNILCDTDTVIIIPYKIDVNQTSDFSRHKSESFKRQLLFKIDDVLVEPLNITFSSALYSDNRSNPQVRLLRDNIVEHEMVFNQTYSITQRGSYYLEVRFDRETEYEFLFTYDRPNNINMLPSTRVTGETVSYTIPTSGELESALPENVNCRITDTGDIETSKLTCETEILFPVDLQNLGVFISPREKRLFDTQLNQSEQDNRNLKTFSTVLVSGLVALLLISFAFMWFMLTKYPYAYYIFGRDK